MSAAGFQQYLSGEEAKNQVTFSLNFRGAGSGLQLKPFIITNDRDLLVRDNKVAQK